jgi:hypothetical protein
MIGTEGLYWNELYNTAERLKRIEHDVMLSESLRPSSLYKPKILLDGSRWCAVLGAVVGMGRSPSEAFIDFDRQWTRITAPTGREDK